MERLANFLRFLRRYPVPGMAALPAVILARLAVMAVPFRFLQRFSAMPESCEAPTLGDPARQRRIASAVRLASHLIPGATCLTQALAAQCLLRLRGEWPKLCVGVRRSAQGIFEAHAWLEANGQIILGETPDHAGYRRMSLPSATR